MTAKRALVVDDSKSARAFLARILERHDLTVDNAESAEEAIEYLSHQRPDVIFMDHLMPGMDGFQAVQAIKNDPRTATIPILMYTSQEGELYLSQARALGALGVLPKQTRPADVSKALYQLKLLPDRRTEGSETTVVTPAVAAAQIAEQQAAAAAGEAAAAPAPAADQLRGLPPDVRALIESLLRDHTAELRRFVVENLENNADRIVGDVRLMLKDAPATPPPALATETAPPRRALLLALAGVLLAVILGALWYLAVENQRQLDGRLATLQSQLSQADERMAAMTRAAAEGAARAADPMLAAVQLQPVGEARTGVAATEASQSLIEPVPFGEAPLAGARVERVQALLERLMSLGFQGTVQIRSFPGRFCMTEGNGEPAAMANEQLPYAKCSQVGNPQDNMRTAQRESVVFANMLAAMRQRANGTLDIQVASGGGDEVIAAYPSIGDALTAGEWNRAAIQNNRVELRWSPRPPAPTPTPTAR